MPPVLYYNDPSRGWTSIGQGPTGPLGPTGPTGPIGVSQDANNAATLGTDGLIYVPQIGGVTGTIVMYAGPTAPAGWVLCDGRAHGSTALQAVLGSANVPDLRDKFIRGAGAAAAGTVGGADTVTLSTSNMPSHSHGGLSGNQNSNHSHSGTSGGMSANASHTHAGTTGGESVDHSHNVPVHSSGGFSANHTHQININEGSGEDEDGNFVDSNPDSQGKTYNAGTSGNPSADHTHSSAAIWTTGRNVGHTHGLTLSSVSTAHTHTFSTGAASATHAHSVSGEGSGAPMSVLPSYYVLSFIIKL